ncbi:MAG: hypothetical protein WCC06_00950 [Candidatus Aminicenantales bacterium]
MAKLWVGITDNEWYRVVSGIPDIDEVNFWQLFGKAKMGSNLNGLR